MPTKSPRPCSQPGCGQPAEAGGKCKRHKGQQARRIDDRRGTSGERGYDRDHERLFRLPVLERDGYMCRDCGGYGNHADHDPHERRDLVAMGENPNDPKWGVTRCHPCHSRKTGRTVGGFHHPNNR